MKRFLICFSLLVLAIILGCKESKKPARPEANPEPPPPKPVAAAVAPPAVPPPPKIEAPPLPSAETARQYLEQQVALFLGGMRNKDQAWLLRLPPNPSIEPQRVDDITVGRVLPAVRQDGTPIQNAFLANYVVKGHYGINGLPESASQTIFVIYQDATGGWSTTTKMPE
ncbi:hypothetical protein K2X85_12110 [bacterium]|nr:hypothetical protein [bacterium]